MKWPPNRRTQRSSIVIGIVLVVGLVLLRNYLQSPDVIVHRAADAFRRKDVDALLAITSPEEVKAMNLTRQTVSDYLNATLYRPGEIANMTLVFSDTGHPDERGYWAYTTYKGQKRDDPLTIFLIQTPRGDWTLNLSYTLYKFYERLHQHESMAGWHRLAAEKGLKGMFNVNGMTYVGDFELHRGSLFHE
jgi:hypothetical protein